MLNLCISSNSKLFFYTSKKFDENVKKMIEIWLVYIRNLVIFFVEISGYDLKVFIRKKLEMNLFFWAVEIMFLWLINIFIMEHPNL